MSILRRIVFMFIDELQIQLSNLLIIKESYGFFGSRNLLGVLGKRSPCVSIHHFIVMNSAIQKEQVCLHNKHSLQCKTGVDRQSYVIRYNLLRATMMLLHAFKR